RPGRPLRDDGPPDARRRRHSAGRVHASGGGRGPHRRVSRHVTWQFSLTGLLIGVLVGLTGMGGGSLMTPILIIFFGFKPTYAVGTDLLHGAIFKSFGAFRHRKLGTVHARLALWMFAGSGPMSLVGIGVAAILAHYYGARAQAPGRDALRPARSPGTE